MSTTSIEQPPALTPVPMGDGLGIEYETADGATALVVIPEVAAGTVVYLPDFIGGGQGAGATICGDKQDRFVELMVALIAKAVSA